MYNLINTYNGTSNIYFSKVLLGVIYIGIFISNSSFQNKHSILGSWETMEVPNNKNFKYVEVFKANGYYESYTVLSGIITREFHGSYSMTNDTLSYSYHDYCEPNSKIYSGKMRINWKNNAEFVSVDVLTGGSTLSKRTTFTKAYSPCDIIPEGTNGKRRISCKSCGGDGYVGGYTWDGEWRENSKMCVKCDGDGYND
jgi:hypothetical protein